MKVTGFRAAMALATLIGIALITLNFSGEHSDGGTRDLQPAVCLAQNRSIRDQEFVETAIAIWEGNADAPMKHFPSGRITSKRQEHPDLYQKWQRSRQGQGCCSVSRTSEQREVADGSQQTVWVTLIMNPESPGDSGVNFVFDGCGTLLPRESGYEVARRLLAPTQQLTTRNYRNFTKN